MPHLLALPDGRHVPLEKPVVSVGSDSACDIVLQEPGVKPSHGLLFQDARGWTVSAAARGCEVRVRNKRVEQAPIAPGESFSVGRVSLTLLSSEAARPAAGSTPEVASNGRLLAVLTGFASRLMVQRPTVELLDVAMRGLAFGEGAARPPPSSAAAAAASAPECGWRQPLEVRAALPRHEDAIRHQRVEVRSHLQGGTEELDERHGPWLPPRRPCRRALQRCRACPPRAGRR